MFIICKLYLYLYIYLCLLVFRTSLSWFSPLWPGASDRSSLSSLQLQDYAVVTDNLDGSALVLKGLEFYQCNGEEAIEGYSSVDNG